MSKEMQESRRNRCSSSRPRLVQRKEVAEAVAEAEAEVVGVGLPWRWWLKLRL